MTIVENEPMSAHTSFKVGGCAQYFAKVSNNDELKDALAFAKEKNAALFIIGNGTNLLVGDKGFKGIVIKLDGEFNNVEIGDCGKSIAEAAYSLARFARQMAGKGYLGVHKLSGIPGTLDGAIYMNAGAYGQEISQTVKSVDSMTLDGTFIKRSANECLFSYRHSIFQDLAKDGKPEIILSVEFQMEQNCSTENINAMESEMKEAMKKRAASQPLNMPNAGSTFKRLDHGTLDMPNQVAPGYYIEQAGLKGIKIGGAQVSEVHANFIVNTGNATANDIKLLSETMQSKVQEIFGVELKREIIFLGDF